MRPLHLNWLPLVLLLPCSACQQPSGSGAPPAASTDAGPVSASPSAPSAPMAPRREALAVAPDFEAAAEEAINDGNYREALETMEKELGLRSAMPPPTGSSSAHDHQQGHGHQHDGQRQLPHPGARVPPRLPKPPTSAAPTSLSKPAPKQPPRPATNATPTSSAAQTAP